MDGAGKFWINITSAVCAASDSAFDSRGWVFGDMLSDEDIAEIEGLRHVAMATNFGTKTVIAGFV